MLSPEVGATWGGRAGGRMSQAWPGDHSGPKGKAGSNAKVRYARTLRR